MADGRSLSRARHAKPSCRKRMVVFALDVLGGTEGRVDVRVRGLVEGGRQNVSGFEVAVCGRPMGGGIAVRYGTSGVATHEPEPASGGCCRGRSSFVSSCCS